MSSKITGSQRSSQASRSLRLVLSLLLLGFADILCAQATTDNFLGRLTPAQTTDATPLEFNVPVNRELASGQIHSYRMALSANQFVGVTLQQRGIDVAAEVFGADNELIADFDNEFRTEGQEEMEFLAEKTGTYYLLIKAKLKNAPAGHYEIRITKTRTGTDEDGSLQVMRTLRAKAARLFRVGKNDEARPLVERAIEIAESALGADHTYVALLLKELGDIYYDKADRAKAKSLYERAIMIFEKEVGPEHPLTADALGGLGNVYGAAGELPRAEHLLSRALEIEERTLGIEHPKVADRLKSLGIIHISRGDLGKAEDYYQRALMIVEKTLGTENIQFAGLLKLLAEINFKKRDYEGAEQLLLRSLTIYEKLRGPEHLALADSLTNLGITARARKDYARAELYYRRTLLIREQSQGVDHPDVAHVLNNLANLYRSKGEYLKALENNLRAVQILEKSAGPYHPVTQLALGSIARTYAVIGDLVNAIKFQSRVDAVIETNIALNLAIGSERQKLALLNMVSQRTDRTVSLNLRSGPNDKSATALATLVLLQRKGRVLDAMTNTLAAFRERAEARDQVLLDQLNETTGRLARLVLGGRQNMSPEEYQKSIKELEERKERLEAEISRQNSEFRTQTLPVTLEAVQTAIPDNAALIEFTAYRPFDPKAEVDSEAFGETRYAVYVIRRQKAPEGKDLGAAKEIDAAVDSFRQALRDPSRRNVRELARSLDEKVMRPVRALVGEAKQLLVSPDGELNLIPFEALVDEDGRYLIQSYSFAYLTSGRDLLRMLVVPEGRSKPLVVANPTFGEPVSAGAVTTPGVARDKRRSVTSARNLSDVYFAPLSGTAQEARTISILFPDASVLSGSLATESALKRASAPRVLHIATHGFFLQNTATMAHADAKTGGTKSTAPVLAGGSAANISSLPGRVATGSVAQVTTRDPTTQFENPLLRSGLALAGANLRGSGGDDGILTALEASGLNLWGTKLVVLSACDTGLGEVRNGEGVYGLRRAFVLAGAESLVMSLWPVSDYSTRTLMTNYYMNLKQGLGRGAALRQVQLEMLRRNRQLHPFYWANFIQSGEWANLEGQR